MNRIIAFVSWLGRLTGPVVGFLAVQANRRKLYGLAVLALPLLVGASVLTDGQAQQILTVLAILASAGVPGLARKHTPKGGAR